MKDFLKRNWIAGVLILLPLVLMVIFWNDIPDTIPIHWNLEGEVDGYGSKISLLLFPGISAFTIALLAIVPVIDPKQKVEQSGKILDIIGMVLAGFMLLAFLGSLSVSLGYVVDVSSIVMYGVLVLLMVLGNYFGKLRPNYFVGIRTPWTLENETVWKKTHRLGGVIWVVGSLIMILVKLFTPNEIFFYVFVIFILVISLVPILYSYLTFRKLTGGSPSN